MPDSAAILSRSVLGWTFAALLNSIAMFMTIFVGFTDMVSAQVTFGIFGLGGGFAHALLIKSAGGKFSWTLGLLFSFIWGASCVAGVTPLFFVMGTGLKMGMMTFYSFAFSGALGGLATAFVMRSLFSNGASLRVIPCTVIWAFSFGFGAMLSDSLGEGLKAMLPWMMVWPVSALFLGMIVGFGGALSTVWFLSNRGGYPRKVSVNSGTGPDSFRTVSGNAFFAGITILICSPFFLNDFSNIYVKDWRLWIFIDYTSVNHLPCLVVFWLIITRRMSLSDV